MTRKISILILSAFMLILSLTFLVQTSEIQICSLEDEENVCAICLDPVNTEEDAFLTRCGHWFHYKNCIENLKRDSRCEAYDSFLSDIDGPFPCPLCKGLITKYCFLEESEYYNANINVPEHRKLSKTALLKYLRFIMKNVSSSNSYYKIEQVIRILQTEKHWDVNERLENGRTMLHLAYRFGNFDALESLRNAGSNIRLCDNDGLNAIDYAFIFKKDTVLSGLISSGIHIMHTFPFAIVNSMLDTTKILYDSFKDHIDLRFADENGNSLLHLAVMSINPKMVEFITEKFGCAGMDIDCINSQGQTPLLLACKIEKWWEISDVAEALINHGAKSDFKVGANLTPLEYVIINHEQDDESFFVASLLESNPTFDESLVAMARENGKLLIAQCLENYLNKKRS